MFWLIEYVCNINITDQLLNGHHENYIPTAIWLIVNVNVLHLFYFIAVQLCFSVVAVIYHLFCFTLFVMMI